LSTIAGVARRVGFPPGFRAVVVTTGVLLRFPAGALVFERLFDQLSVVKRVRIARGATLGDEGRPDLGDGVIGVTAMGVAVPNADPGGTTVVLRAIPYHLWANREPAGMRVWIPRDRGTEDGSR
jgi:hypothetical protein